MSRLWNETEINYLKNNYVDKTAKEIAKKIKRSESSVRNKVTALGLNKAEKYDLTGRRSGKIVAIRKTDERVNKKVVWECVCDCGMKTYVISTNFTNKLSKSCGCERGDKKDDIKGEVFGRLTVIEETDRKTNNGKYLWVCECDCGKESLVPIDSLRSGRTTSCGCYQKEVARKTLERIYPSFVLPSGKDHYRYNPNISDEERAKSRSALYNGVGKWRDKVFERDKYSCVECGKIGRDLNAHHLDGWNWCEDKRFDVDNGVTLCVDCHNDFHNKYGRGNNTSEQFAEFQSATSEKPKQKA